MKRARFMVAGIAALSLATALVAAPPEMRQIRSKSFEPPAAAFDHTAHLQKMVNLQERLSSRHITLANAAPLQVRPTPSELDSIREAAAMEQKLRVGIVQDVFVPMSFSRALIAHQPMIHDTFGAVRGNADGSFDWAGVVRSPEAAAVRIHFSDFDLPDGAELYVYADNGMAFGPYTGRGPNGNGDFWTNTISGPEVIMQMNAPVADVPRFTISGVGHVTGEFSLAQHLAPQLSAMADTKPCSFNDECVVDAACTTRETSAVDAATDAVANMLFVSGRYMYLCSGGLVADSDTSSRVPYFVTANHCISKGGEASSLETFFFYRASSCGACPSRGAATTTGSSIVSTNRTSDYTLLRLSQDAPAEAAFLGWTADDVAGANNTNLYRLSHPGGAPQAYSEHVVDTSKPTCRSWPRGAWIYSQDVYGATEGGSSGSPVVNAAGKLVGQLSGACGYDVNNVCNSADNATVDGAFAAYYSAVSGWLGSGDDGDGDGGGDGGGTCTDADGDGYCAEEDCDDNDASVNPGAKEKGKNGRDGKDNDCNGIIDG